MNTLFNIDAKSLFMSPSSFHPFMCSASKHRTPGPLTSRWMPACIQSGAAAVIRITNHVYLHPTGVSKCLCAFISCFLVHHWHPDEPRGPLREASLSEAGERRVYWLQRGHCFPARLSCEHMPTRDIGKGWPWESFVDCDIGRGLKKKKKPRRKSWKCLKLKPCPATDFKYANHKPCSSLAVFLRFWQILSDVDPAQRRDDWQ